MISGIQSLSIQPTGSIREAVACIDRNERGIVLVTDEQGRLQGTVTDGDVRRSMLAGASLDEPVSSILARKAGSCYSEPVTAWIETPKSELLRLMKEHSVRQIPLLDGEGRVAGLITLDELTPVVELPLQAVIMAGGPGTRLRPLTEEMPKPMLPVGDRPLMERMIDQLRGAGIKRVSVTTHYKGEKISGYFGNGEQFGVELTYLEEDEPLGTAGALGLMPRPSGPILVINGDILTRVSFRAMLDYHRERSAELTVAVRKYEFQVPYGVVECEGDSVCHLREKPSLSFFVNAGIYLMEPLVHEFIPTGLRSDMTDLIETLIKRNCRVVSFPIVEYWLDIGRHADYLQAQEDVKNGRMDL
jgi:dTDP-glucose pyrophosphorylase/CBS domain-containing protein